MSRYKPTPPQKDALRVIAIGGCWEWSGPVYTNRDHGRLPAMSVRRLIREQLVEVGEHQPVPGLGSVQHHKPVTVTADGKALLVALDGGFWLDGAP